MLGLPPGCSADELERLADWLEASVLVEGATLAASEVMEELQSSGLALPSDEAFTEDSDEMGADLDEESSTDALERLAGDVLAECRKRAAKLGGSYPFELDRDVIALREGTEFDCYAFLLVADLGHHYPELKDALTPDAESGRLMEKIVEAATKGIFGRSQRFGWPREPEWPTAINERIDQLGKLLSIPVDALEGKTEPADNDRTLDVVGVLQIDGSQDATLVVLVQCAAGKNWKQKLGDPSVSAWQNLLLWNSMLIRAVALPWRLGGRKGDWRYSRIYQMSNCAMVLDRPRLLTGRPDVHLDPRVRSEIEAWWRRAINKIPYAGLRPA